MKFIEKLNSNFKENKIFYVLVVSFFFVGILLGSYTIKYMGETNSSDLANYYTTFIKSLNGETIHTNQLLVNILKSNILIIALIIAFSFVSFGGPIILILDLIKGFTLGYTFSFLLTTFEGRGLWLSLVSTIPQNLFYIPFFIGMSIVALELSSFKFGQKFLGIGKKRIISKGLILKFQFLIFLFIAGVLVEGYICPGLIKLIVTNVYKVA